MKGWLVALVLALPIAGLAATVARMEIALSSAQEWVIPVTGFDPRDPLRGHYIVFRYLWEVEGDPQLCRAGHCLICLEKNAAGKVLARILAGTADPDCPGFVDPQASRITADFGSRIYVSETSAQELERQMRDQPMQIVARLRRDGVLVNERLEPAAPPADRDME